MKTKIIGFSAVILTALLTISYVTNTQAQMGVVTGGGSIDLSTQTTGSLNLATQTTGSLPDASLTTPVTQASIITKLTYTPLAPDGDSSGLTVSSPTTTGVMSMADKAKLNNIAYALSDYADLQTAVNTVSAGGGGIIVNTRGADIAISSTFVPKENVSIDLNDGGLSWAGGAGGTMIENDSSAYGVKFSGMYNGYLNPGANVTTVFKFHSIRSGHYGNLRLKSGNANMVFMDLAPDAGADDPEDATRNVAYNTFGPFISDSLVSVPSVSVVLTMTGTASPWRVVTGNNFIGPWVFFTKSLGLEFKQYCDSNNFEGLFSITLANDTVPGTCVIFNNSASPSAAADVWGEHIEHLSCETWYPALANQQAVVINHAGGIKIDYMGNDRVAQGTWPVGMVTDNYSQGHDITYVEGSPNYIVRHYLKGKQLLTASTTTTASLNIPHGAAPSSPVNGDIWTTTSGLYVRTNGTTHALLQLDSSDQITQSFADSSPSNGINITAPSATRFPNAYVRIWNNGQTNSFPSFQLMNLGGTNASSSATASGITLGKFMWQGYGTTGTKQAALFSCITTTTFSDSDQSTDCTISVGGPATSGTPLERFRIKSSGNVGIGTTAPASTLEVNGDFRASASEVISTSTATLTASQVRNTIINSYGRSGAVTNTLPAAAAGYNFNVIVGTQHNSAWKFQRQGSDTIIVDGTASKTYFQETNQAVGSSISCWTFQTGASAWTWKCRSESGTWATD